MCTVLNAVSMYKCLNTYEMNEYLCSQLDNQKFMENILYKCYGGYQNEVIKISVTYNVQDYEPIIIELLIILV